MRLVGKNLHNIGFFTDVLSTIQFFFEDPYESILLIVLPLIEMRLAGKRLRNIDFLYSVRHVYYQRDQRFLRPLRNSFTQSYIVFCPTTILTQLPSACLLSIRSNILTTVKKLFYLVFTSHFVCPNFWKFLHFL